MVQLYRAICGAEQKPKIMVFGHNTPCGFVRNSVSTEYDASLFGVRDETSIFVATSLFSDLLCFPVKPQEAPWVLEKKALCLVLYPLRHQPKGLVAGGDGHYQY